MSSHYDSSCVYIYACPRPLYPCLPTGHEADNHDDAELAFHRDEVRREQESLQTRNVEHFPLNDAAAIGDLKVVQKIVQKDPTAINLQDRNGWQPMHEGSTEQKWSEVVVVEEEGSFSSLFCDSD